MAESPDGLRLDAGLLDRQHATVPPGRVQAVRITQPLLWRRRDWVRVEMEVAGTGSGTGDGVLVPVADWRQAAAVLARVLPGVDPDAALAAAGPVPRRARWCAPVVRRGYGHGVTPGVFVARQGLLTRRTTLVPHAKVQSVRFAQGPWERRHRLADVVRRPRRRGHRTGTAAGPGRGPGPAARPGRPFAHRTPLGAPGALADGAAGRRRLTEAPGRGPAGRRRRGPSRGRTVAVPPRGRRAPTLGTWVRERVAAWTASPNGTAAQ